MLPSAHVFPGGVGAGADSGRRLRGEHRQRVEGRRGFLFGAFHGRKDTDRGWGYGASRVRAIVTFRWRVEAEDTARGRAGRGPVAEPATPVGRGGRGANERRRSRIGCPEQEIVCASRRRFSLGAGAPCRVVAPPRASLLSREICPDPPLARRQLDSAPIALRARSNVQIMPALSWRCPSAGGQAQTDGLAPMAQA